jgi:hypothetical protein
MCIIGLLAGLYGRKSCVGIIGVVATALQNVRYPRRLVN